jgi:hypothetical protein
MNEIQVNKYNADYVTRGILDNVVICSNMKKHTKRAEIYLRCGGGLDTESTTVTDESGKPLFAFLYHIQICINGTYFSMRDIRCIIPFFRGLCQEVKKYKEKKYQPVLVLWVANLGHEYAFLKKQLAKVGITDLFAKDERQPLRICLQNCVELRECLGLFGRSLDDIAKSYTTTQKLKGDLDYNLIRVPFATELTDAEKAYCKNDVVILDELSEVAFEKFTDKGLKMPMTKTGILRQKCKRAIHNIRYEYRDNEKLMPKTEFEYYIMRRFMFAGGLSGTSPLFVGIFVERSKCADITSDYPAQMNHRLYPAGELIETAPENIMKYKGKFKIILFTCNLRPKTKHAVISKHKVLNFENTDYCEFTTRCRNCVVINGKLLFADNVCLLLNDVDIKALSELYYFENVLIYRAWYFTKKARAPKFLRDCMNSDYLTKQQLKATGQSETILYKESKSAVNSYFGMTCTRLYDCLYCFDEDIEDIKPRAAELSYNEQRQKMWLSPYIGYWCTSYARSILIHYIAKYPDLILQYDTDSLYYITDTNKVPAERIAEFENDLLNYNRRISLLNKRIFNNDMHFDDLGAWEIDKADYIGFKGLGAKRYLLQKANGDLKPVVAGMVKKSFTEYVEKNHVNPFDVFKNDLTLSRVSSRKLASKYFDNPDNKVIPVKVTDYQGHTEIVEIYTYHALFAIEFKMKVAAAYEQLCQAVTVEKGFPVQYRKYENWIKEVNANG